MIKKFKSYSLSIVALLTLLAPAALPAAMAGASSTCTGVASGIQTGANDTSTGGSVNCGSTGVDTTTVGSIAKTIVTFFSIIVGAASIIMIIYGGFRYITSGGDSGRVGNAKNTLIYAIVGLVIVALAQLIVHFVLAQTTNISTPPAAT
jgi:hypothetical protein